MSLTNTFESDLLLLIFNATTITGLGRDDTAPITNLYVSLHTADPGETGNQGTSETTYTGYSTSGRIAVARTSGGWTVSGTTQVANAGAINFSACTGGSTQTITHAGIGTLASGTGKLLVSGALSAPLDVSNGITPSFAAGALIVTLD